MVQPLYIAFTLDCQPAHTSAAPEGPKNWEQSSQAIDGFCTLLRSAGYPATVFVTPSCAEMHSPLLEDLVSTQMEVGLYIQPQSLAGARYRRHFGQFDAARQREIVATAIQQYQEALGQRPQSVRSAMFSASDDTFGILYGLGFQQGSLSNPGRRVAKHAAVWTGAPRDAHYVRRDSRLAVGDLPFLEVPVTTDADQERGGLVPDLMIEHGTFETWQRPLIEGQLRRMEDASVAFRVLCLATRNVCAYRERDAAPRRTLDALLTYLASLEEKGEGRPTYELRPVTLAAAHVAYRRLIETEGWKP